MSNKRCTHCNTVFSFEEKNPELLWDFLMNDKFLDYCPTCKTAMFAALQAIPVKFKKTFIETKDYTKEQIAEAQINRMNGYTLPSNVEGLFAFKDDGCSQMICERMLDPVTKTMVYYSVSWWPKRPYEFSISKEVWWDIEKDCIAENQDFSI